MKIIVSLTSFPARIKTVHKTIKTLLCQSLKPDMVVLWLAYEQFPNKEKDLPEHLLELLDNGGMAIRWCNDIRSYKKLIPALKEFPDDIIVTADDDALYSKNWLKMLVDSYRAEAETVIHCHRITKFFRKDGKWEIISGSKSVYPRPTYLHKLTGLGGVLYPPGVLHPDVVNQDLFMKLAPSNDDIWFWFMAVRNNVRVKYVDNCIPRPKPVKKFFKGPTLSSLNDHGEQLFWKDFNACIGKYPLVEQKFFDEIEQFAEIDR